MRSRYQRTVQKLSKTVHAAAAPKSLETVGRLGYRFHLGGDPEVTLPQTAAPVVGRQRDVEVLEEWFRQAAAGTRKMVFISREAGVRKTTLVDLWLARLTASHRVRVARGQCVEHYGEGEPYLPILEALGQLAGRVSSWCPH